MTNDYVFFGIMGLILLGAAGVCMYGRHLSNRRRSSHMRFVESDTSTSRDDKQEIELADYPQSR